MIYPLQSKAWDANNIEVELTHQIRSGTIHHPQTGTKPLMKSSRRVLEVLIYFLQRTLSDSDSLMLLLLDVPQILF